MRSTNRLKIINVVGARPNLIKIAPLIREYRRHKEIKSLLVHTGQHYDFRLSDIFFKDLLLPRPDICLGVGSAAHGQQISRVMQGLGKVFASYRPDLVVVVGDVNSTAAAALACAKSRIRLAHVEAGLRSFDRQMPEETNRLITDAVSDYLFAPSQDAVNNLKNEGMPAKKIFLVGNIMIDTLLMHQARVLKSRILNKLGLKPRGYAVLTLHRPSNVDSRQGLLNIIKAISGIQKEIRIVFPLHPRTKFYLNKYALSSRLAALDNLLLLPPLGYLDFMRLVMGSRFVMTDSGGIQEETTALKVPCLTLRENTERPVTVNSGTNLIAGSKSDDIIRLAHRLMGQRSISCARPKFWDGKTAQRIVRIILRGRIK
jgi:UDP-N-acetylglucosamine 2-epimerase (non-hydrolysing)